MKKLLWLLPLLVFIGLGAMLYRGLGKKPQELPSALLMQAAPAFNLAILGKDNERFSHTQMLGQVWLFNVWGSWCPSCLVEHPVLNALAAQKIVPIIGLNWRDKEDLAKAWLVKHGNPYVLSVRDSGDTAINYGVTAAPETFVIDKRGIVRRKIVGPLTDDLVQELLPFIAQLKAES